MARATDELTIALATPADPRDAGAYSGWPASLLGAMNEVTGRAVGLDGSLPARVHFSAALMGALPRVRPRDLLSPGGVLARTMPAPAFLGRPVVWARSARLRAGLRRHGPADGCITLGTELSLPRSLPTVTYQDSTLIQAKRSYPWPYLGEVSDRDIARFAERQRAVYRSVTACCCSSQWAADSIVSDYGIPREKVHVVGIGRNHDVPAPDERDWATPRFLFVGFDWVRKNGDAMVRSFAEVRRVHPEAELHLVGGHPPISETGVIGHGLVSLGDSEGAELLAGLYRRATCFVMASLHEPSATAYAEAAATGLPCIGTTDGGSATIIGPGGVLVDPRDPRALTEAMLHLADPAAARRLGALASAHAAQLTWPKVVERLVRALRLPDHEARETADFL